MRLDWSSENEKKENRRIWKIYYEGKFSKMVWGKGLVEEWEKDGDYGERRKGKVKDYDRKKRRGKEDGRVYERDGWYGKEEKKRNLRKSGKRF